MKIGGLFCLEESAANNGTGQGGGLPFISVPDGGDLRFCMSGRCAIYYCLLDLMMRDSTRAAYLPAYTCETVVAPYKKAGYTLKFYDISPEGLTPLFDRKRIPEISVLGLCGYYGFSSYDRDFVGECVDHGVTVIEDITHSVFSADGKDGRVQYLAGSFRKWLGVAAGGIAIKRNGRFEPDLLPPEEEHIQGRLSCFEERRRVMAGEPGASDRRVEALFWETELRLRKLFDAYESDDHSVRVLKNFPYRDMITKRRNNYGAILDRNPFSTGVKPVFPLLYEGVCPSHMSLYSPHRDKAQEFLARRGIGSTFYWPFPGETDLAGFPGTAYITDHIFSVPVDQRYTKDDMELLCDALADLGGTPE